jgi:CBS domain-containing protein
MEVRDIMTPGPFCCLPFEPVQNAAKMMRACALSVLPVVADQHSWRLKGIINHCDLRDVIAEGTDPATTPVEAVMTRDPVTCRPHDNVESCLRLMAEYRIRWVPVIDNHGTCIGIVVPADITRLSLDLEADLGSPRPSLLRFDRARWWY